MGVGDGPGRTSLPTVGGGKSGAPGFFTSKLDALINWSRVNSLWPMPFGTACCAIEMMATAASKYDQARFGMERMAYTPRQADVLICAGRLPYKMAPVIRKIWDQMPQPKWAIAMGACASSGNIFDAYSMTQGIDNVIPVDVYIPGCPPRPEALLYGLMMLQEKIRGESVFDKELHERLRRELAEQGGQANLPPATIDEVALPFGNSTKQNRVAGLVSTAAVARPADRQP